MPKKLMDVYSSCKDCLDSLKIWEKSPALSGLMQFYWHPLGFLKATIRGMTRKIRNLRDVNKLPFNHKGCSCVLP